MLVLIFLKIFQKNKAYRKKFLVCIIYPREVLIMNLKKTDINILKIILEQKEVHISKIENILNISSALIKISLKKIDNFLIENKIGLTIIKNNIISLNIISNHFNLNNLVASFNLSAECRQTYLMLNILTDGNLNASKQLINLNIAKSTLSAGATRFIMKSYNL